MKVTSKKGRYLALALLSLVVVVAWLSLPLLRDESARLRGDYPVRFYGRAVDGRGNAMPNVTVCFAVDSDRGPPNPDMYSRSERRTEYRVVTDAAGDFELTGVYGFAITIKSFNGSALDWAFGPRDRRSPCTSFVFTERTSAASIPDTPERRLVYYLAPKALGQAGDSRSTPP